MRTLAVILFTLIILPVYSQTTLTIKGVDFEVYFDRAPYENSKYTDFTIGNFEKERQVKLVEKLKNKLSIYSINVLKYIPSKMYFVYGIEVKATGEIFQAACFGKNKMAFLSTNFSKHDNTIHHEIFHGIVAHFPDKAKKLFNKTLNLSVNAKSLPIAMRWDNGNPYYKHGYTGSYGLKYMQNGNPEECLADIFADYITQYDEVVDYVNQNPHSLLAQKYELVVEFLNNINSSFLVAIND